MGHNLRSIKAFCLSERLTIKKTKRHEHLNTAVAPKPQRLVGVQRQQAFPFPVTSIIEQVRAGSAWHYKRFDMPVPKTKQKRDG